MAKIIEVIYLERSKGCGATHCVEFHEHGPVRLVRELWSKSGHKLCEDDPINMINSNRLDQHTPDLCPYSLGEND